ncbi:hypothetical protein PRZ48_005360 [Zasmidium cellare]|uniref:SnoaL-like domain-containing protein n=1 Tax=Zasmidium cellare TaxID=395010 RepID=A0ABR0ES75_ZASCE|nr:hypothetical protein PRZ48_005360 [Zasmidium cellare]
MTSLSDCQRRTAVRLLEGWDEHTVDGLLRDRTPDCLNGALPKRLGRHGRSNDEIAGGIRKLSPLLDDVKMKIWNIISDPEQHQAVVHATAMGETPLGFYENEHVFFLSFNEDGSKVNRVEEYVDTSYSEAFVKKMQAYAQK